MQDRESGVYKNVQYNDVLISAIQKFTLLDYLEKTACIVFTPGCNMRCGYCHNPEFVLPEEIVKMKKDFIPEKAFWHFLDTRVGNRVLSSGGDTCPTGGETPPLLDGVVISGGEPTMQGDLIAFIRKVKEKGFLVKLDTNGNRPEVLQKLLDEKLLDYIAMDLKTDLVHYPLVCGSLAKAESIVASIALIKNAGIEYEFRTTLVRELHNRAILESMAELVAGAKRWYLQTFRPGFTLDPLFRNFHPFDAEEISRTQTVLASYVQFLGVR